MKLRKAHTSMKLKYTRDFTMKILLSNNYYMHLPPIVHTHACQMYMTIMYTRLKHELHFITSMMVMISVQDDDPVDVFQRMNYLIKESL